MADPEPQDQQKSGAKPPASSPPQDYHAALAAVISGVTHDRALLRKLVYALAWQNLKPEVIVARPIPKAQAQAKSISELEQALQLERAIDRIEAEAREQKRKQHDQPPVLGGPAKAEAAATGGATVVRPARDFIPTVTPGHTFVPVPGFDFDPPVKVAQNLNVLDVNPRDLNVQGTEVKNLNAKDPRVKDQDAKIPDTEKLQAPSEPPRTDNAVVSLSEQQSSPEDASHLERIPSWLDPDIHVSPGSVEDTPINRPAQTRSRFIPILHLIAASMIGVVLVIGIFGSVYLARQSSGPAPVSAPSRPAASAPGASKTTPQIDQIKAQAPVAQPVPGPQPSLPFPLPKSRGVYAGSSGQSFELEPLPVKIPDSRTLVSAEITKPSIVTIPGDNLAFVAFRSDLVNTAPQTVAVHVVARVQRTTKFVGGQLGVVPLESIWRIRSKAYEFQASPLEGHSEMIVIQPNLGFVFSPGRYALVLNGSGYDFTVAGTVTAPEQCLEQVEAVNGAMLSECPKI